MYLLYDATVLEVCKPTDKKGPNPCLYSTEYIQARGQGGASSMHLRCGINIGPRIGICRIHASTARYKYRPTDNNMQNPCIYGAV